MGAARDVVLGELPPSGFEVSIDAVVAAAVARGVKERAAWGELAVMASERRILVRKMAKETRVRMNTGKPTDRSEVRRVD